MIDVHVEAARAFRDLRPEGGARLIMADPPWRFETRSAKGRNRSAERHYATLTLPEIAALPVRELAAPDCLLWLWATNPMLPHALEVMRAWGFEFATAGHWAKMRADGRGLSIGTGYWLRGAGEPFLIGKRGRPPRVARTVRSLIAAPRGAHSRKPAAAMEAAEALAPGGPWVELFARRARPGWLAWGDEAPSGAEAAG